MTERLPDWIFFVVSKITSVTFHERLDLSLAEEGLEQPDGSRRRRFYVSQLPKFQSKGAQNSQNEVDEAKKTWGTFCILHKLTIFLGYEKNCCLIPWRFKEFLVASIDFLQKNGTCRVFLALHHWTAMENGKCGLKEASATVL